MTSVESGYKKFGKLTAGDDSDAAGDGRSSRRSRSRRSSTTRSIRRRSSRRPRSRRSSSEAGAASPPRLCCLRARRSGRARSRPKPTRRERRSTRSGRSSRTATSIRRSTSPKWDRVGAGSASQGHRGEDARRVPRGAGRHARPPRPVALRGHSRRRPTRPATTSTSAGSPGSTSGSSTSSSSSPSVDPDGGAAAAGVRAGWIVRRIGGTPVSTLLAGITEDTPPRLAQLAGVASRDARGCAARPARSVGRSRSSTAPARR